MDPAEFILWAIIWFIVGRVSGRVVVEPVIDRWHGLRTGRGG